MAPLEVCAQSQQRYGGLRVITSNTGREFALGLLKTLDLAHCAMWKSPAMPKKGGRGGGALLTSAELPTACRPSDDKDLLPLLLRLPSPAFNLLSAQQSYFPQSL